MVKPQFELPRDDVDERGVVADPAQHAAAVGLLLAWARARGWRRGGVVASPLRGPAGNREFLCWLRAPRQEGAP